MRDQAVPGHNRWHPDNPSAAFVQPGSEFRVECREWTDAQLGNNDSANDVRDVDLTHAHMLSGPIEIQGAEPGDLLVVDILDLGPVPQETGPAPGQGWGYTGIFAKTNAGGFLTDYFPTPTRRSGTSTARCHLPAPARHPLYRHHPPGPVRHRSLGGAAGQVERARAGADRHRPGPGPPLALPPLEQNTLAGTLTGDALAKVAREGARTVPARENGGNHDIKNFTRGTRVFYPVHVAGAKLSGGDLHFSQGDGEVTFCGAIEMGGFIDFGVDLIKDGMAKYGVSTNPVFMPGNVEPRYWSSCRFIGVSVDHDTNTNYYMDATVAYRRACLNAIEYLKTFGYSGEQAYLLLGSAPIEGRISGIVDIPNACCSLYLPTAIFDFDIRPTADGPRKADRGQCAVTS